MIGRWHPCCSPQDRPNSHTRARTHLLPGPTEVFCRPTTTHPHTSTNLPSNAAQVTPCTVLPRVHVKLHAHELLCRQVTAHNSCSCMLCRHAGPLPCIQLCTWHSTWLECCCNTVQQTHANTTCKGAQTPGIPRRSTPLTRYTAELLALHQHCRNKAAAVGGFLPSHTQTSQEDTWSARVGEAHGQVL